MKYEENGKYKALMVATSYLNDLFDRNGHFPVFTYVFVAKPSHFMLITLIPTIKIEHFDHFFHPFVAFLHQIFIFAIVKIIF